MFEIIPKTFWYDFVARRRFWAVASFTTSFAGILLFFTIGPLWSIDFTGGTEIDMHFDKSIAIQDVRKILATVDIGDDAVQQVGDPANNQYAVRIQGDTSAHDDELAAVRAALEGAHGASWMDEFRVENEVGARVAVLYTGPLVPIAALKGELAGVTGVRVEAGADDNTFFVRLPGVADSIQTALAANLPDNPPTIDRSDSIGPKVGDSLRTAGLMALIVSTLLHLVYVAIRFDFTFAPGAIICLVHDVCITVGVLVATRQEFGLSTISALLTLSGYSLNDTIVVYDRIRENMERYRQKDFGGLINDSINQTLSRTIMTAGATSLAMIPFLFIGGPVLFQFAYVMLIGIVVGTYSSIYVAAPLTMIIREYEPALKRMVGFGPKAG
ncbi:MAG: protein translocase subunit SecF [Myxococcales bacterium]|nr:protein translocase subunit SecF [Myxococcales bacterium]